MWWWTEKIKIGLAASAVFCAIALPVFDGQITVFPPLVITADTAHFKVKPEDGLPVPLQQPMVYCGVTIC